MNKITLTDEEIHKIISFELVNHNVSGSRSFDHRLVRLSYTIDREDDESIIVDIYGRINDPETVIRVGSSCMYIENKWQLFESMAEKAVKVAFRSRYFNNADEESRIRIALSGVK